jgi:Domain of unknown function (DUF4190)
MSSPYPPAQQPAGPGAPSNTLGLVSMILGIASIPLTCCFYLGFPVGIAAAITGYMGKKKAEEGQATNRGQAVAGMICGGVAIALGILGIILVAILNVVSIPLYNR